MGVMGTFEDAQVVVVPAGQVRRHRQQLKVRGRQWCDSVGARERLERGDPLPPLVVRAGTLQPAESVVDVGLALRTGLAHPLTHRCKFSR
jgi:hypothetical protein